MKFMRLLLLSITILSFVELPCGAMMEAGKAEMADMEEGAASPHRLPDGRYSDLPFPQKIQISYNKVLAFLMGAIEGMGETLELNLRGSQVPPAPSKNPLMTLWGWFRRAPKPEVALVDPKENYIKELFDRLFPLEQAAISALSPPALGEELKKAICFIENNMPGDTAERESVRLLSETLGKIEGLKPGVHDVVTATCDALQRNIALLELILLFDAKEWKERLDKLKQLQIDLTNPPNSVQ